MMGKISRPTVLVAVACLACLAGCVDRRFVITTDPPGAIVYDEKHRPMGAAPADRQFVYYGKYKFTLVKDGFQTQVVEENVKTPWYEYFPLDFFAENLIPFTIKDVRRFHYKMSPALIASPEDVLNRGMDMRQRDRALEVPPRPDEVAPPPTELPIMPKAKN